MSKRQIITPAIPAEEIMKLRAHIDECYDPPDYSVSVNYVCDWSQFGSDFGILGVSPFSKP